MKALKRELTDLQRHPEPDLEVFKSCGMIVREAAEKAAKQGYVELYEKYKNVRHCSPPGRLGHIGAYRACHQAG